MKVTAVIAAGGSGSRFNSGTPKQFLLLLNVPLIIHTLRAFQNSRMVGDVVVTLPKADLNRLSSDVLKRFRLDKIKSVVPGGASRQESVLSGMNAIDWPADYVAIHDAARCLITPELIDKTIQASQGWDGAIAAMPVRDTLKHVKGDTIERTEPRENLWGMQTPQVFRFPLIRDAYRKAEQEGVQATDDAQLAERAGGRLRVVEGSAYNLKVTVQADLDLAATILREREAQ